MIFSFLCLLAQEIDSSSTNDITEIVRTQEDCKKHFEKKKKRDEEEIEKLKNINFENFFPKLFELQEFKNIKSNKIKILYLYIEDGIPIANNVKNYNCIEYYNQISFSIYQKLWNKENYKRFQKFFKNKIIIPSIYSNGIRIKEVNGNLISADYLTENDIKPIYEGLYIDSENNKKKFYYTSDKKPKKELELYLDKKETQSKKSLIIYALNVFPTSYMDFSNVYFFELELYNGEKRIRKELFYQYVNNQWKLIETKN